jgi:hypothetical protein
VDLTKNSSYYCGDGIYGDQGIHRDELQIVITDTAIILALAKRQSIYRNFTDIDQYNTKNRQYTKGIDGTMVVGVATILKLTYYLSV